MAIQPPLSSLISLKALSSLFVSKLKVLSSLAVGDGDPPPISPLSTL